MVYTWYIPADIIQNLIWMVYTMYSIDGFDLYQHAPDMYWIFIEYIFDTSLVCITGMGGTCWYLSNPSILYMVYTIHIKFCMISARYAMNISCMYHVYCMYIPCIFQTYTDLCVPCIYLVFIGIYQVYTKYIPSIYWLYFYTEYAKYIPGIYQVYIKYIPSTSIQKIRRLLN